ncbi:hypothetical protein KR093_004419, partial [Drosophila rubida]
QMIIVITMRITVPAIFSLNDHKYFRSVKLNVIIVYISVTAAILLEMILIYLSISLMYVTSEWIIVLYVPLLFISNCLTFKTFVLHLSYRINDEEAQTFLKDHFVKFIEHGDEFWIELQRKLVCCGLEGPKTYLDYLHKVHKSCYLNQNETQGLIVIGCNDVVYDLFYAVRKLADALCWFVVLLQFVTFVFYSTLLIRKLLNRQSKSRQNYVVCPLKL